MRVIGLDVHRSMAVIAVLENGHISSGGRVDLTRDAVIAFGRKLRGDDEVVIEATVNTATIVRLLRPFVRRVVIANPLQVRAIAHAKIKTDKIDATVLAKLHASGFPPRGLDAGQPAAKGRKQGRAHAYNSRAVRERERAWLEQTEQAYTRFVANWQSNPAGCTGAANGRRSS